MQENGDGDDGDGEDLDVIAVTTGMPEHHKDYIKNMLETLQSNLDANRGPLYSRLIDGRLFVSPPNPVSALYNMIGKGDVPHPIPFYLPEAFLWVPEVSFRIE